MALAGTSIKEALKYGYWKAFRDGQLIDRAQLDSENPPLTIGPNSVGVTLHPKLLVVDSTAPGGVIDLFDPNSVQHEEVTIGPNGYVLEPGEFCLGAVRESFECSAALYDRWDCGVMTWGKPDVCRNVQTVEANPGAFILDVPATPPVYYYQELHGRSTIARNAIQLHFVAGFGDYGFSGQFTLEIAALKRVRIYPGIRVGQISFERIDGVPQAYKGAYNDQFDGPKAAVIGRDRF